MKPLDWLILLCLGITFGASFSMNHLLLTDFGPLTISTLRVGIAACGCWFYLAVSGTAASIPAGSVTKVLMLGIFQFSLPFAVLPISQVHITSSVAGIANAMTPVAVVGLSLLVGGGEKLNIAKFLGIFCGVFGTSALVWDSGEHQGSDPRFVFFAVLAPVSYAIALILVKALRELRSDLVITWAATFGFLSILPVAIVVEGLPKAIRPHGIGLITVHGLCLTALPILVLYPLIGRVGAMNASLLTFIAPISAMVIGVAFLGENLSPPQLIGVAFVLIGLMSIDGRIPSRLWMAVNQYATTTRWNLWFFPKDIRNGIGKPTL